MVYYKEDIIKRFPISAEDIEKYIKSTGIKVAKDGKINNKSYQALITFYENTINGNGKPKNIDLIKDEVSFQTSDKRITLYQNDAIKFLENLPANSVDVIITDPAYSGMNQKLKLGRGKIIGRYADAGKEEAKWFDEFHERCDYLTKIFGINNKAA